MVDAPMQLNYRTVKIVLAIVLVILNIGLVVFILLIEKNGKKDEDAEKERQKAKARVRNSGQVECTPDMCRLTRGEVCVPAQPFMDARAFLAFMNQPAYNALATIKPDLIGIPRVGKPFQVALDLSDDEVEVVAQALFEGYEDDDRDALTVMRISEPPALLAFRVPLDPGEAPVLFCNPMLQDCSGRGVDIWVPRTEFGKFPRDYCEMAIDLAAGTDEMAEKVKAVASQDTLRT